MDVVGRNPTRALEGSQHTHPQTLQTLELETLHPSPWVFRQVYLEHLRSFLGKSQTLSRNIWRRTYDPASYQAHEDDN